MLRSSRILTVLVAFKINIFSDLVHVCHKKQQQDKMEIINTTINMAHKNQNMHRRTFIQLGSTVQYLKSSFIDSGNKFSYILNNYFICFDYRVDRSNFNLSKMSHMDFMRIDSFHFIRNIYCRSIESRSISLSIRKFPIDELHIVNRYADEYSSETRRLVEFELEISVR